MECFGFLFRQNFIFQSNYLRIFTARILLFDLLMTFTAFNMELFEVLVCGLSVCETIATGLSHDETVLKDPHQEIRFWQLRLKSIFFSGCAGKS